MGNYKKQHYVPQLYLSNFVDKSINKVHFYYKDKENIYASNIKDVAEEKDYYTLKNNNNKNSWELFYSLSVEPDLKKVIEKLIKRSIYSNDRSHILNRKLKKCLVSSLLYQFLRGPHVRDYVKNYVFDDAVNETYDNNPVLKESEILNKMFENLLNDDLLFKMSLNKVATRELKTDILDKYFYKYYYVIYVIKNEMEFITCDNPVMICNINGNDIRPFEYGLKNINTSIVFPINTKTLVVGYNPMNKEHIEDRNKLIYLEREFDIEFISIINKRIFEYGKRFVFSDNEKILRDIANRK